MMLDLGVHSMRAHEGTWRHTIIRSTSLIYYSCISFLIVLNSDAVVSTELPSGIRDNLLCSDIREGWRGVTARMWCITVAHMCCQCAAGMQ